ncbi:MAG: FMN-binding protein [bacterium]
MLPSALAVVLAANAFWFLAPPKEIDIEEHLKAIAPEAQSFVRIRGQPPYYKALDGDGNTIGLLFLTTDVVPEERGYAGPIKILVGIDAKGKILGIEILSHNETPSYVRRIREPWFTQQFREKDVGDPFIVGKDIDGITGATVTVEAIARSVGRGGKKIASQYLGIPVGEEVRAGGRVAKKIVEILFLLAIFSLGAFGLVKHDEKIRYVVLAASVVFLGFIENGFLSVVNIVNIASLNFPSPLHNPFWYVLILLGVGSALLVGRFYCGWICPFGGLQELVWRIVPFKLSVSPSLSRRTSYVRFGLLWGSVVAFAATRNMGFCSYEPFAPVFNRVGGALIWVFIGAIFVVSSANYRFWCRYFCPVGAALGLLSSFSFWRLRRSGACDRCDACAGRCPVDAFVEDGDWSVDMRECIQCNECRSGCPRGALVLGRRYFGSTA